MVTGQVEVLFKRLSDLDLNLAKAINENVEPFNIFAGNWERFKLEIPTKELYIREYESALESVNNYGLAFKDIFTNAKGLRDQMAKVKEHQTKTGYDEPTLDSLVKNFNKQYLEFKQQFSIFNKQLPEYISLIQTTLEKFQHGETTAEKMIEKGDLINLFKFDDHNTAETDYTFGNALKIKLEFGKISDQEILLPKRVTELLQNGRLTCDGEKQTAEIMKSFLKDKKYTKCQTVSKQEGMFMLFMQIPPNQGMEENYLFLANYDCDLNEEEDEGLWEYSNKEDYDMVISKPSQNESCQPGEEQRVLNRAGWKCHMTYCMTFWKRKDQKCKIHQKRINPYTVRINAEAAGKERLVYILGQNEQTISFDKQTTVDLTIKDDMDIKVFCGRGDDHRVVSTEFGAKCSSVPFLNWVCRNRLTSVILILSTDILLFTFYQISITKNLFKMFVKYLLYLPVLGITILIPSKYKMNYLVSRKNATGKCPLCKYPTENFEAHFISAHGEIGGHKWTLNDAFMYIINDWVWTTVVIIIKLIIVSTIIYMFYVLLKIPTVNAELSPMEKNVINKYTFEGTEYYKGYHPFKVRGFIDESEVQTIDVVISNKKCEGDKCFVSVEADITMKIEQGMLSGYKFIVEDQEQFLKFRINNPTAVYKMEYLYQDCATRIETSTGDTCTAGCDDCLKALSNTGVNISYADTSNWGCNDWACWAINQGCTCARCFNEPNGDCYDVFKIHKQLVGLELCIENEVKSECFQVSDNNPTVTNNLKAQFLATNPLLDKKIVALHLNTVYQGEINELGEHDDKFGALQIINPTEINCKPEVVSEHHCIFGQHRWLTVTNCCKDTHHKKQFLQTNAKLRAVADSPSSLTNRTLLESVEDYGTLRVIYKMDKFPTSSVNQKGLVRDISIEKFYGCPVCVEGAIVNIKVNAEQKGLYDISSNNALLTIKRLNLNKGVNSIDLSFKTWKINGTLHLKINDKEASSEFSLKDERKGVTDDTHSPHNEEVERVYDESSWLYKWAKYSHHLTSKIRNFMFSTTWKLVLSICILASLILIFAFAFLALGKKVKEKLL